MKKTYIQPQTFAAQMETEIFICTSKGVTSTIGDDDIDYGGVDENGGKDPSSRRRRSVWDEEEEDDF